MRSVFLSQFIGRQSVRSQPQTARQTTSSFARLLETFQGISRSPSSFSHSLSQGQFRQASPQSLVAPTQVSRKAYSLPSTSPRLTRDPRFLTPLSLNGGQLRSGRKGASSENLHSHGTDSPGQAATIRTYGAKITATADQFGIDPALSLAVARAESGVGRTHEGKVTLNPRAVSPAGAVGLFQLMEATGKEQLQEIAPGQRYNPLNPSQNIQLGVSYLKEMRETFSEDTRLLAGLSTTAGANLQEVRRLAVAAYNAGPGRVARAQELARAQGRDPSLYRNIARHLPQETRRYVEKVERFAKEFRGENVTLANRSTTISTENVT